MSVKLLKRTPLFDFHLAHKAKIVPYAGWEMPLQYADMGMVKEHVHSRQNAALFDVSHMCQVTFLGDDRERFLEWVTPADIRALKTDRGRLSLLMLDHGGIKDDCIIVRGEKSLTTVFNAGCAPTDLEYLRARLEEFGGDVEMHVRTDRALIALQGPQAAAVLDPYVDNLAELPFMATTEVEVKGIRCQVTRSGYTGEDGFEISVANEDATALADVLSSHGSVRCAGLGARDTLRQESGLCLYGHEISEKTDPISADLLWTITKRRREEGNFIGAEPILEKLRRPELVTRVRVGIISPMGPCPRENTAVLPVATREGEDAGAQPIGMVTSGTPSPIIQKNVAQAFLDKPFAKPGTLVDMLVRGKKVRGEVVKLPFIPTHYHKLAKKASA